MVNADGSVTPMAGGAGLGATLTGLTDLQQATLKVV